MSCKNTTTFADFSCGCSESLSQVVNFVNCIQFSGDVAGGTSIIFESDIPVVLTGSITNTNDFALTVNFVTTGGTVTRVLSPGSSISFVYEDVTEVNVTAAEAPFTGTFKYQVTYGIENLTA